MRQGRRCRRFQSPSAYMDICSYECVQIRIHICIRTCIHPVCVCMSAHMNVYTPYTPCAAPARHREQSNYSVKDLCGFSTAASAIDCR